MTPKTNVAYAASLWHHIQDAFLPCPLHAYHTIVAVDSGGVS
jgi:hypothetical protein